MRSSPRVASQCPPPHAAPPNNHTAWDIGDNEVFVDLLETIQTTGRALAVVINQDPDARRAIRDILRDSPWSAHRVTLEELIKAEGGEIIANSIARVLGESTRVFQRRVESLPPLDFLMPNSVHRKSWSGTPGVALVASLGPDSEHHAIYGFEGDPVTLEDFDRQQVYVLLQPAEPRLKRVNPQAAGQGDVIQHEADANLAYSVVVNTHTIRPTNPSTTSPLPGPTILPTAYSSDATNVDWIKSYQGDGGFDNWVEVLIDVRFYDELDRLIRQSSIRFDIEKGVEEYPAVSLISEVLPDSGFHSLEIDVTELDSFLNGNDDDWGKREFGWIDRGERRTVYKSGNATIGIELDWQPRPASKLTSVMVPYTEGMFWAPPLHIKATAQDQYGYGLSGYNVSNWWVDNPAVASLTAAGGMGANVTFNSIGSTRYGATIGGISGYSTIVVQDLPNCPPPQIRC